MQTGPLAASLGGDYVAGMQKPANPLLWGAVAAVVAAVIVVLSQVAGIVQPDNPLLDNPIKAGLAAAVWGVGLAYFRNWWASRR